MLLTQLICKHNQQQYQSFSHPSPIYSITLRSHSIYARSADLQPSQKTSAATILTTATWGDIRTRILDLVRRLARVLLKVLLEQPGQLRDLLPKVRGPRPALLRIQQLGRHAGARRRHLQVERLVALVLCVRELAGVDGVKDGPGVLQRAPLPARGGARAHPARVQ